MRKILQIPTILNTAYIYIVVTKLSSEALIPSELCRAFFQNIIAAVVMGIL